MKIALKLLIAAVALVLLGFGSYALSPHVIPDEPEVECAPEGEGTSGLYSEELDCPISYETGQAYMDYHDTLWPLERIGILLIFGGVLVGLVAAGFGVAGLVKRGRSSS
ncbi:MAG: hypothetical protein QM597_06540 [Aeromicrobium sp.]|uniref:hypothetical protein n=1 Tax=Aeromicrobium sp. TaxID=1871063 RepID=UPI0039E71171